MSLETGDIELSSLGAQNLPRQQFSPSTSIIPPAIISSQFTTPNASENEPEHPMEMILPHIIPRMRLMKRLAREARKTRFKRIFRVGNAVILGILTFISVTWTIYGLYQFSEPANTIAMESLQATKWANYSTWAYTICPTEKAKNLTTPACEEAQNSIVPAPEKPVNFKIRTIGDVVANQIIPWINGSESFYLLLANTKIYCEASNITIAKKNDTYGNGTLQSCSDIDISKPYSLGSYGGEPASNLDRRDMQSSANKPIPLPPQARKPFSWIASFAIALGIIFFIFGICFLISWLDISEKLCTEMTDDYNDWNTSRYQQISSWRVMKFIPRFHPAATIWFIFFIGKFLSSANQDLNLARWVARDEFLDTCLSSSKNLSIACFLGVTPDTPYLSIDTRIKIAAIWRGYLYKQINNASYWSHINLAWSFCFLMIGLWVLWAHGGEQEHDTVEGYRMIDGEDDGQSETDNANEDSVTV